MTTDRRLELERCIERPYPNAESIQNTVHSLPPVLRAWHEADRPLAGLQRSMQVCVKVTPLLKGMQWTQRKY
jgi:hypothetical protein